MADQRLRCPRLAWSGRGVLGRTPKDTGASNEQVRDTLSWEASGHKKGRQNFFYQITNASSLISDSQKQHNDLLKQHIMSDIWTSRKPVVVAVNDFYLPGWPRRQKSSQGTEHLVSITGYDNHADTYTYVETCGTKSCGTDAVPTR